jgi:hypothetical protein
LNELFAHNEKYYDHGEDGDTDGEYEDVTPACVCEITADDRTHGITAACDERQD